MLLAKVFGTYKSYGLLLEKNTQLQILGSQSSVPKWRVLAGSKMTHSVSVFSTHQYFLMLVDTLYWDLTYKDLLKKIVCNSENKKCIMHWCESCPVSATLKEFLDQRLNKYEGDEKFNYCQWNITDQVILTTITSTYKEYKDTLIDVIDDLTRHSYTV